MSELVPGGLRRGYHAVENAVFGDLERFAGPARQVRRRALTRWAACHSAPCAPFPFEREASR